MNILILSRGPQLYSTRSLELSVQERGHRVRVLDYMDCVLSIEGGKPTIYVRGERLEGVDAIIPRIGGSATFHGAAVIRQFEQMGVFSLTPSEALLNSRDKLKSLQLLATSGVDFPKTIFSNLSFDSKGLIRQMGGTPLVIKLLSGTHGMGVVLAKDQNTAEAVMEAFFKTKSKIILQEYIEESKGEDIRVLVLNGKVVAAMKRKAREGEFRSNLHRGGDSEVVKLTAKEKKAAIKAVEAMGLHLAGVDILQSNRGPLVLEVNASPGLEGIETTTGIDVAGKAITFLEKCIKKKKT